MIKKLYLPLVALMVLALSSCGKMGELSSDYFTTNPADVTRTSIKFDFSYDPANTACFKFICIKNGDFNLSEAYSWVEVPSVDASQEDLWRFFNTMDQSLFMNLWPRSASGTDSYTLVGLEPGAEVAYAYYAEDMDGVTSEIKVATVTLEQMQVGADPEVEIIPAWAYRVYVV